MVTKAAQFVLEDDGGLNIAKLKETIEDCGFDFELLSTEKVNYTSGNKTKIYQFKSKWNVL